jgi:hypothetical protein
MLEEHRGDGLFYEWLVDDILEIVPVCGEMPDARYVWRSKEMINRLIIQAHLKVLIALFRLGKP